MNAPAFECVRTTALKGMSLSAVAKECGVPLTTLSGLRAEKHGATLPMVMSIADGMGVDASVLFPELNDYKDVRPLLSEKVA